MGQILTLLTTSSGNLVYHIVLVFLIACALWVAIQHLRASKFPQARRAVTGLCVLLALQLALFITNAIFWQDPFVQQTILPPLDRTATLLTLIWIVWLWTFPEPTQLVDAITLLLNLLGGGALGFTLILWAQNSTSAFNLSALEIAWQILSLIVILAGILLLVLRKPASWGHGLAMLALAFLGHFISLVYPLDGNYPGFVRLMQLAAFPLLLTLSQRFPTPIPTHAFITRSIRGDEPIRERRRYSTDPRTFQALLSLAAENDTHEIGQAVVRGIAQAMLADLCFLFTLRDDKNLTITCGYDLIREEELKGAHLNREAIPLIAAAIEAGRPLHLPASSTSADLRGLGQVLNLANPGHLLSVPIVSQENGPIGSFVTLSPYSNRLWNADDQAYLSSIATLFIPIIERIQRLTALETERDQYGQQAQGALEQLAEIQRRYEQAAAEVENLRAENVQVQLQAENTAALLVSQEKAKETIEQLTKENEQLRSNIEALETDNAQLKHDLDQSSEQLCSNIEALETDNAQLKHDLDQSSEQLRSNIEALETDNAQLKHDLDQSSEQLRSNIEALETDNAQLKHDLGQSSERLRNNIETLETDNAQLKRDLAQSLEEVQDLRNQLKGASAKVPEPKNLPEIFVNNKQAETIIAISQELRRSMSSVVGYTDLLMGESVGILGTLQRKFLERIQASSERLGNLVDDLGQVTQPESSKGKSERDLLDLNLIVDNAMTYTSPQIREKNITLRLDLAEITLQLRADRDALQQILIHLLQNATAATYADGNIVLHVQLLSEDNYYFLVIQVTDSGGGIAAEDISRVFTRRYHAEGALIQGLGDKGVGLSIAKKLVEAQDGRIWVATEPGTGSTFSVLLPVVVESS